MRPYLEKNPSPKRASGVAQGVGPEFKSQPCKKKKLSNIKSSLSITFVLGHEKIKLICIY
jgi:hypothetical protein